MGPVERVSECQFQDSGTGRNSIRHILRFSSSGSRCGTLDSRCRTSCDRRLACRPLRIACHRKDDDTKQQPKDRGLQLACDICRLTHSCLPQQVARGRSLPSHSSVAAGELYATNALRKSSGVRAWQPRVFPRLIETGGIHEDARNFFLFSIPRRRRGSPLKPATATILTPVQRQTPVRSTHYSGG